MSFADLIGNKRVKKILKSYLKNKRIPHSMIFVGPNSANAFDFAIAFAKSLNCRKRSNDSCDSCRYCRSIDKNQFPDVRVMMPEGQYYKKEQISQLIGESIQKPLISDKRVTILRDIHKMNENAANTFLKTLEEPAPSNVFILLTNNLNNLLPTIQSRCQLLKFSPPSKAEITASLIKKGVDEEKAHSLAYVIQGNREAIPESDIKSFESKRNLVYHILEQLIKQDNVEDILLDLYDRSRNREQFISYFKEMLHLISLMLRDIMVLMIDGESPSVINIDFKDRLMALTEYIPVDRILWLIQKMEYLLRDIQRNLNSRILILEFINSYTLQERESV